MGNDGHEELLVPTAGKTEYGSLEGEEHGDHTGQYIQRLRPNIWAALLLHVTHLLPATLTDHRCGHAVGLWYWEIATLLTLRAQWHYVIPFSQHYLFQVWFTHSSCTCLEY